MARRVRTHLRRGRPSKKKEFRGLLIFLSMTVVGSILGGVETVSTKSRVNSGTTANTIPFGWIALTVLCVLLMIVLVYLYRKRIFDRVERLNDLISTYQSTYQVARSTTDVVTYMNAMKSLGKWEKTISERKEEIPNWARKNLETLPPENKNVKKNYQWWLRDVIDHAKAEAIKACKGVYKNSNQDRESTYWAFINNVYAANQTFDQETVDAANSAAMAVYRAAGSFFTPRAPFVLENDKRNKESNNLSLENVLHKVDSMSGREFERFCADLLRKNGYTGVKLTQASGDQGVDILAEKGGVLYAIQCKCYASDLGNTPVQEVNAGRAIYNYHVGAVLTNRYFTRGAKEAAAQTHVLLWDRDHLIDLIRNAN